MSQSSASDPSYLSTGEQPHQQQNNNNNKHRYIPQSPQPDSPPLTPSPSSPPHDHIHNHTTQSSKDATKRRQQNSNAADIPAPHPHPALPTHTMADSLSPSATPDNYAYNLSPLSTSPGNSRTNSSNSSLAGMGINFPPEQNLLPIELSSPSREPAPLPRNDQQPPSLTMQRTLSSEGTNPLASVAMLQTASAGPLSLPSGSTSTNLGPQLPYGGLHPTASAQFTARPRTVSPRTSATVDGFASSSSVSQNPSEARGRVISPNKLDGMGVSSPIDYVPSGLSNVIESSSTASANPYEPSGASFNHDHKHDPYGSQPYYPLTGKEAQYGSSPTVQPVTVPFRDSVGYWLGMYFFFNLGLTLFNKFVLVSFPFPYTLTGLHALSGCAGTYFALEQGAFVPARLTQKENLILAAFSVLYTINIAVSNISLQLVTVPFHQVVRASTPLFTIVVSTIFLRTKFSLMKLVSLLPVVAGVGFATYGDYYFTAWGLILTLLGTFLAALKTVVTNVIQTGGGGRLKLHPLDLLMRMSPLAFIQCVIYGWYTGELERVRRYGATQMTRGKAFALLINGIIACGLNIVSFTANKKAGALTMTVSANCKQVLTIALAVVLFNLHISPTNGLGILLTLIGGGWYAYVEYMEKKKKVIKLVDRA